MICRKCGADVAPSRFCSRCGAAFVVKTCRTCGAGMTADESFCPNCGTREQVEQQRPRGGQDNSYRYEDYDRAPRSAPANGALTSAEPRLKTRPRTPKQVGNKHVGLRGFLGAMSSLGALAVMLYFYVFGNMFTTTGGATVSPLLFTPDFQFAPQEAAGGFVLFKNFEQIWLFLQSFANPELLLEGYAGVLEFLPAALFVIAYLIAGVLLAIAAIIAVFRFLSGVFSHKEYDLMLPIKLALTGYLSMLAATLVMGYIPVESDGVLTTDLLLGANSGLVYGIIAGGAAVGVQILLNMWLAGKRFFKAGAVMKWLTNLLLLATAAVMFLFIPKGIEIDGYAVAPSSLFGVIIAMLFNGGFADGANWLLVSEVFGLALMQIGFIWQLASLVGSMGKRAARTFKFDGYEDKSCVKFGIGMIASTCSYAALVFTLVGYLPTDTIVFAVCGIVMFILSLLNRVFLNKDQL